MRGGVQIVVHVVAMAVFLSTGAVPLHLGTITRWPPPAAAMVVVVKLMAVIANYAVVVGATVVGFVWWPHVWWRTKSTRE